jgi:hypothetical protein
VSHYLRQWVERLRVFENRVLRRIFGPKRDEVTGEWRELHNENLNSSPRTIRVIKSRRMRRAGHVARMGRRGTHMSWWIVLGRMLER